jgi:predicted nuclease of predicted toxin-antitoxin system
VAEAIDRSTAFAPEARTVFRRDLVEASVDDVAWARLVLHLISDAGLWPITARLLELAVATADAEFVEALILFLTNPKVVARRRTRLADLPDERRGAALNHGRQLLELLQEARDPWRQSSRSACGFLSRSNRQRHVLGVRQDDMAFFCQ